MASPSAAAEQPNALHVKILYQLSGSDEQHSISGLPASTTVGQLKSQLTDALSHKPAGHHQRLIYRGKLLARDGETLGEIFDSKSAQPHILHLVVREPSNARPHDQPQPNAPQTSTTMLPPPPPPSMPANPPQLRAHVSVPANMAPHSHVHALPNNPTPVQLQTPFDALNGGGHVLPGVPSQLPPHLLPHFQQHMQALRSLNPGLHQHGGMQAVDPRLQTPAQHVHPYAGARPLQRDTSQSVHSPQVNQTPRIGRSPQRQDENSEERSGSGYRTAGSGVQPGYSPGRQDLSNQAAHGSVRHGSNGELSITYSMAGPLSHLPGPPGLMNPFAVQAAGRPAVNYALNHPPETRTTRLMPNWPNMPALGTTQEFYGAAHAIDSMQLYRDDLARLQDRINDHSPAASSQVSLASLVNGFRVQAQGILRIRNRAQQMVNDLLLPGRYPYHNGLEAADVARLQLMNAEFVAAHDRIVESLARLEAVPNSQPGEAQSQNRPQTDSNDSDTLAAVEPSQAPITAYLLNSPQGPQAMVFHSDGIFNNATRLVENNVPNPGSNDLQDPVIDQIASIARNRRMQRSGQERMEDRVTRARDAVSALNRELASANEALTAASSAVNNLHSTNAEHARSTRREAGLAQAPVQQPPAQQQAAPAERHNVNGGNVQGENDVHDLGNILFHTFWHLWTIVKVFAFIWLFTRGMSTRRTVMLILASLVYLAAQAGLFGDHWDRIRRHFENLIGLPQGEGPAPPAQQAATDNGSQPPLDPRALADRLMQQRRERDRNWLTERLVPVERAVALFIASLYPGVGERHIQAREQQRAEQQRQREEAERAQSEAEAQRSPTATSVNPSESTQAPSSAQETDVKEAGPSGSGEGSSSAVRPSDAIDTLRERNKSTATPSED